MPQLLEIMKRSRAMFVMAAIVIAVAACTSTTPPAAPAPTSTITIEPSSTPLPTQAPASTSTPLATPTPEPTPTSAPVESPTETPVPTNTPAPTATLGPAPTQDRVGLPEGYQDDFVVFYTFDRPDRKQVREIYANDAANSVEQGEPFPHGSILIMETWSTIQDDNGDVVLDDEGRYTRDSLGGIFIMRKEQGFGEAYSHLRSGEWEYVAFRPDGTYSTPPERTANCAFCHQGATSDNDFVFRGNLAFAEGRYGTSPMPQENMVSMTSMSFFPRNLTVKSGASVTWMNDDVVAHTTSANEREWSSGLLAEDGESFTFTFDSPGTFSYVCGIHPAQMSGTIEVVE